MRYQLNWQENIPKEPQSRIYYLKTPVVLSAVTSTHPPTPLWPPGFKSECQQTVSAPLLPPHTCQGIIYHPITRSYPIKTSHDRRGTHW